MVSHMGPQVVHVLGMDDLNRRGLGTIRGAQALRFHALLEASEVVGPWRYRAAEVLDKARRRLREYPGPVDALIGDFDFPVSTILPILRRELGHATPSLESVLRCEDKYWSRLVQSEVIPEHTPRFAVFDPGDERAPLAAGFDYPFWVKPVKSFSSYLGFAVRSPRELQDALEKIRRGVGRLRDAFGYVLGHALVPDEVAAAGGGACIAEEIIDASHQATVEGYVFGGEVVPYAIVDSLRLPGASSFRSYEYPSQLPERVQRDMRDVAVRVMRRVGLEGSPFNVEFFWDEARDRLWVLEINPRISRSHAPLFELVRGASHHEVAVDLALGNRPAFPRREGRYRVAGKYFVRTLDDAVVQSEPRRADFDALIGEVPDARVSLTAHEGDRLSDLLDQDSYSYVLAVVYLGADSHDELRARYRRVDELLPFELAAPPSGASA